MVRLVMCLGALAGAFAGMGGCNSNPPPRPMPQPLTQSTSQSTSQQATPRTQQAQTQEQPADREAQATRTAERPSDAPAAARSAEQAAASAEPNWYRPGVFELEGVEHRAFAVTAADVREARSAAMRLAYDAYPRGQVAAHEAVRLADGSWRFYVLMAAGG